MSQRLFLVRVKHLQPETHVFLAERVEVHGEHIVLLQHDGRPAAMFCFEAVQCWTVV
jgi:hypothetical protein